MTVSIKLAIRLERTVRRIPPYLIFIGFLVFYLFSMKNTSSFLDNIDSVSAELLQERIHPETAPSVLTKRCDATDDLLFPLCKKKFQKFKQQWKEKCHGEKHNINISDPCSILIYLSEIEPWCPLLPWRQAPVKQESSTNSAVADIRTDFRGLEQILNSTSYDWIRMRIKSMWSEWVEVARNLKRKGSLKTPRKKQQIVIFLGGIAHNFYIIKNAFKGGPLGELVQWSDVIASLYVLGHDLVISIEPDDVIKGRIFTKHDEGCGLKNVKHDRIFTDIIGDTVMEYHLGPTLQKYRCKELIVDSFGTEAEFNYAEYKEPIQRSGWGNRNLLLKQFLTMYPHSPDNLFLGFAIPKKHTSVNSKRNEGKPKGVIYAKLASYLEGKRKYLDVLSKHIELHGTMAGEESYKKRIIPDYVINHGVLNGSQLTELLSESKVFIGLGFPYEGPGPLDALANGCFYINPKYTPPVNKDNNMFFSGKPTLRKVTSQNPYTEEFVGKPFVHTIDINNETEVENAIKEILHSKEIPYLPYQFTVEGMLQRMNVFTENLDFCTPGSQWPPKSEMKILKGNKGESCKNVCFDKGFLCEPSFFRFLNDINLLKRFGLDCPHLITKESIYAPAYNSSSMTCLLQEMSLLYSCVARDDHVTRLCPCRTYQREQVALYEGYTG